MLMKLSQCHLVLVKYSIWAKLGTMTKLLTDLVIMCRSGFLFLFELGLENKGEGNNLLNCEVCTMANMYGIWSCKHGWSCGCYPSANGFQLRDLSSSNNRVVNAMCVLFLITSPIKNTVRRINNHRLRGSIASKFCTAKWHTMHSSSPKKPWL